MSEFKAIYQSKPIANWLDNASIIFVFLSFYFYLIIENITGLGGVRIVMLLCSYLLFFTARLFVSNIQIKPTLFFYYISSIFLYIISFPFWMTKFDINIYLSTVTALLVISNYDYFINALKVLKIIAVCLALYEFINKEYIFVVFRDTGKGLKALDEKMFGGLIYIFRAKVFFEGPLALSQLAIGISFLLRKEIKYLLLIFVLAVLANGRLGMIITFMMIVLYFFKRYNIFDMLLKPKILLILIGGLIIATIALANVMDEASIKRLFEAFNTSNDGSAHRMNFWKNGILTWLDYDIIHLIFGNNGYFGSLFNNNAENGWITLLINNGLIGFLYYFLPVLFLMITKRRVDFAYIFALFFCMFIQTFHLGASANLIYWLIIYSFLRKDDFVKT